MALTLLQFRIVNIVLPWFAVLVTSFRLFDRTRTRRLWWDDAWIALSMVLAIIFMVAVEIHLQPKKHSQWVNVAAYYMCTQLFCSVAWTSRISILFTIIRISVPGLLRRLLKIAAVAFGITWAILFAQVLWVCEKQPGWKESPSHNCHLGENVAIAQVITDVITDAILILAPLRLVWRTNLSRAQKIRVMAIFSTTLITTGVSLNHAYFVLGHNGEKEGLAAVIQTSVSLIVANLSVIVAYVFRIATEESPSHGASSDITTFGSKRKKHTLAPTFITIETEVENDHRIISLQDLNYLDAHTTQDVDSRHKKSLEGSSVNDVKAPAV